MHEQLHIARRDHARGKGIGDWLAAEFVWFARAFAWALLGSAIVSYVYLFRLGPRFLESSDAPVRSYSWAEYVFAPFATILNPFGFIIVLGWAILSLLPARLFIRHKSLGRCTIFASIFVLVGILIGFRIGLRFLAALGPFSILALPFAVLCVALLVCRFWPGSYFTPRKGAWACSR